MRPVMRPLVTSLVRTLSIVLLTGLLLGLTTAGALAEEGSAATADPAGGGGAEVMAAVKTIRDVGTAMMSWLTDHATGRMAMFSASSRTGASWTVVKPASEEPSSHAYSLVSYSDVVSTLVPDYIAAVPENDPWGNPYQFAINSNLLGAAVLGIRSAGSDGSFAGDHYEVGAFPRADTAQDLVWVDGYFARWPQE